MLGKFGPRLIGTRSEPDQTWRSRSRSGIFPNITWVKGHMDIEGNELVDKAAKEAAEGESSEVTSLPSLLAANPLPGRLSHALTTTTGHAENSFFSLSLDLLSYFHT